MTAAHRIAARQRLEDARESVLDARDGGADGGMVLPGGMLYDVLCRVVRDLDAAIDELRF